MRGKLLPHEPTVPLGDVREKRGVREILKGLLMGQRDIHSALCVLHSALGNWFSIGSPFNRRMRGETQRILIVILNLFTCGARPQGFDSYYEVSTKSGD
jgi:hypothetical protein